MDVARPKTMLILLLCHPQVCPLCSNTPADVLPKEIAHRGKQGFEVPFGTWFRRDAWRTLLDDCLSAQSVRRRGVFDPVRVDDIRRAILAEEEAQRLGISTHQLWHRVWTLLMFELWARQYLD